MATPIDIYVDVTIQTNSASVSRTGFGTPILLGYFPTSITTDRVLTFNGSNGLSALVTAGFAITDPIYKMAQALLAQSPRVKTFKIGRLQAHQQTQELYIDSVSVGDIVKVKIIDTAGDTNSYSQTAVSTSVGVITSSLTASMMLGLSTSLSTTFVGSTITAVSKTAGDVFYYFSNANCTVEDVTADPGFSSDLGLIVAEDNDWYAAGMDVNSYDIIDATATYIETLRKLYFAQSNDSNIASTDSDDIATELYDDGRKRSVLFYHHKNDLREYPAIAWMGLGLPKDPGSLTWMFKSLSGVSQSKISATEKSYLDGKNVNYMHRVAGRNITEPGKVSDGSTTTYIDIARLTDWIQANIEEDIFGLFVANDKLPYTDPTIDLIDATIYGVYELGAEREGLILTDYTFDATAAGDQTAANRLARLMAGITFAGTFSGAVHSVQISGNIAQ